MDSVQEVQQVQNTIPALPALLVQKPLKGFALALSGILAPRPCRRLIALTWIPHSLVGISKTESLPDWRDWGSADLPPMRI